MKEIDSKYYLLAFGVGGIGLSCHNSFLDKFYYTSLSCICDKFMTGIQIIDANLEKPIQRNIADIRASARKTDQEWINRKLSALGLDVAVKKPAPKEKIRSGKFKDHFNLDIRKVLEFERNGHVAVRNLCSREELGPYYDVFKEITDTSLLEAYRQNCSALFGIEPHKVKDIEHARSLLRDAETPFLQLFHLRKKYKAVAELAFSERFSKVAADLLGAKRVRIYQDALFVKRPGHGPTRWHSDLNMAPIDTNAFVTMWLPLHDIPSENNGGSGLYYASKSHRDFSLVYFSDLDEIKKRDLSSRYETKDHGAFRLGDAAFHHGWTLHGAPEAIKERYAFTVSYFADDGGGPSASTKVLSKKKREKIDMEDHLSFSGWLNDVQPNQALRHETFELVYERENDKKDDG